MNLPPHPTEAGHWYARNGTPVYTVIGKNGKERPTTLRDAKKLLLVPSVTGIIKMAHSEGLERWKQQQVLLAALTLPRRPHEPDTEFCRRVMEDSTEQTRKASERGTAIHAAIQAHYDGRPIPEEYAEHVKGAVEAVQTTCGEQAWGVEKSFAHYYGYGGKLDLSCYHHIVDFKSKEFGPDNPPDTWDEHAMQLAAYRKGLDFPLSQCYIGFVSVTHPGLTVIKQIDAVALARGWRMFRSLLDYWHAKSNYISAWGEAA